MDSNCIPQRLETRFPVKCRDKKLDLWLKLHNSQLCLKQSSPAAILFHNRFFLSLNKRFYSLKSSYKYIYGTYILYSSELFFFFWLYYRLIIKRNWAIILFPMCSKILFNPKTKNNHSYSSRAFHVDMCLYERDFTLYNLEYRVQILTHPLSLFHPFLWTYNI